MNMPMTAKTINTPTRTTSIGTLVAVGALAAAAGSIAAGTEVEPGGSTVDVSVGAAVGVLVGATVGVGAGVFVDAGVGVKVLTPTINI